MGINIYNDEERKFSKLKNDLKNLPKIETPNNFEYNLLTKIQNRSFSTSTKEREGFNFIKFFAPSAIVVAAIIAFFIFLPNTEQQIDNPLMSEPQAITSNGKQVAESIQNETSPSTSAQHETQNQAVNNSYQQPANIAPPASGNRKSQYPINQNRSVAIDEFISGDNQKASDIRQGNVVNSGAGSDEFDGFFVREQPDQKTIERYRAMVDSVKKAQAKQDSLKKAKKTK